MDSVIWWSVIIIGITAIVWLFRRSRNSRVTLPTDAGWPNYSPYKQPEINQIYNILFCDDFDHFKPQPGTSLAPWQAILFAEPVNPESVQALAADASAEGRIRALAYHWLRSNKRPVPKGILLGVIVEVPLAGGLDVIAAFSDGSVRYINQTGKLAVIEGGLPETGPIISDILGASQQVVAKIGPWDKHRLSPPKKKNIRLTFLVSDGLYFGEGPMAVMARQPMAATVIQHATKLLQVVVKAGIQRGT
jgi:hypothetical protein